MNKFFTRERFGQPQVLAGLLLLLFLAQCLWLVSRAHVYHEGDKDYGTREEISRVQFGLQLWGKGPGKLVGSFSAGPILEIKPQPFSDAELWNPHRLDPDHSALWYLMPATPFLFCPAPGLQNCIATHLWMASIPNLIFAVLLGASLWYVARRLYGNAGGYTALAFYCFSPTIILSSASWFTEPEMGAAWGAFGAIFTAIAVSHTLYAPREVVLWNWRRILLLGLSFALAVGFQFALILIVPVALLFMFYLAPKRKRAAFIIWLAACAVAVLLLFAAYGFHPGQFGYAIHNASLGLIWKAFAARSAYWALLRHLGGLGPGILAALPVVLIAYAIWSRTRYFGNTAPLLVTLFLLVLDLGAPHYPGMGFGLMAVPFLFVFTSGVIADFLETGNRPAVLAGVLAAVFAGATWNIWQLFHAV